MTLYSTHGRRRPGRHRPRRESGRLRQFARAVTAITLVSAGGLAGLVGFVVATHYRGPALEMATLAAVLCLAGWWLALPPGEAWQILTGTTNPQPLPLNTEKTHA